MSRPRKTFSRIVSAANRHRVSLISTGAAVLLFAIVVGSRTPMRLHMDDFLPIGTEESLVSGTAIDEHVSTPGRIVVYVESDEAMTATEAGPLIDALASRLRSIEGIDSVRDRLNPGITRFLESQIAASFFLYLTPSALELVSERLSRTAMEVAFGPSRNTSDSSPAIFGDIRLRDPLRVGVIAARTVYEMAGSSPIQIDDGYFSLQGRKIFFLIVQPSPGVDDLEQATTLVHSIDAVLVDMDSDTLTSTWLSGKKLGAIGRPISYVAAYEAVSVDVARVTVAASLVIFILLVLFFRSFLAALVAVLPILFGLAVTAIVAFFVFGSISLLAWIFVGVLVGLGVDFGLHITAHYRIFGIKNQDRLAALELAVARPGKGIVLAGLTTATAFFTLSVISYPVMTQIGILTGVGLLAILVGTFAILVPVLSTLKPQATTNSRWENWGSFWSRLSRKRPTLGVMFWLFLLAAAVVSGSSIPFEPHPWNLALRGNPKTTEMNRLSENLGSSFTPIVLVSQGISQDDAISIDRNAVGILRRGKVRAGIASIESISNWLPREDKQVANIEYVKTRSDIFSPDRFRREYTEVLSSAIDSGLAQRDRYLEFDYPEMISQFLTPKLEMVDLDGLKATGLREEFDRFLVEDDSSFFAISYIYLRRFPWAEGVTNRFLETFRLMGGDELEGIRFMGDALRSAGHTNILRRDLFFATFLSLVLVLGILALEFRRALYVALCLLPAICGIGSAFIVMGLLQIELNLLTLAIAPIIIGIGIDDGIHIVQRLRTGDNFDQLFRETVSIMTMTTLTTVSAFACLGLASYDGIRELGLVGAVALSVCLIASLHLVPICFRFIDGRP